MSTRLPVSRRIADALIADIRSGRLKVGDKLPSTKDLAEQWDVAPATASRAVKLLHEDKLVETDPGRGVYVVALPPPKSGRITRSS